MTTRSVPTNRLNNPLGIKRQDDSGKTGLHIYVLPAYPTSQMLCTQCLRPQSSTVHTLYSKVLYG